MITYLMTLTHDDWRLLRDLFHERGSEGGFYLRSDSFPPDLIEYLFGIPHMYIIKEALLCLSDDLHP
jgi:hypothetical protein